MLYTLYMGSGSTTVGAMGVCLYMGTRSGTVGAMGVYTRCLYSGTGSATGTMGVYTQWFVVLLCPTQWY